MTDQSKITYYALLSDVGKPIGILRRTHETPLPRDETFRRDLSWRPSQFLRKYELGHNDNDYAEISAEEAERLIEHWRVKWSEEDAADSKS